MSWHKEEKRASSKQLALLPVRWFPIGQRNISLNITKTTVYQNMYVWSKTKTTQWFCFRQLDFLTLID
jgi:hypothetical protein